jgi:adenine phosphoribosyltransferase
MSHLKKHVLDVQDFPKPGVLFRDITPLIEHHFPETLAAMDALYPKAAWKGVDAVAGIESRGFIFAAALAALHGKGFVPIRKKGKLPPPVVDVPFTLEYGNAVMEMRKGKGRLLVIDDVLATGGTLKGAAELCAKAGYAVAGMGVLIDLRFLNQFRFDGAVVPSVIQYD